MENIQKLESSKEIADFISNEYKDISKSVNDHTNKAYMQNLKLKEVICSSEQESYELLEAIFNNLGYFEREKASS